MSARLLLVCALLAIGIGCRKASTSAATESSASSASPVKTEAGSSIDEAQALAALGELTQAVRKYAVEQQRAPKSIDEVVAAGYLSSAPVAPVGKRFAINKTLQVYLTK